MSRFLFAPLAIAIVALTGCGAQAVSASTTASAPRVDYGSAPGETEMSFGGASNEKAQKEDMAASFKPNANQDRPKTGAVHAAVY